MFCACVSCLPNHPGALWWAARTAPRRVGAGGCGHPLTQKKTMRCPICSQTFCPSHILTSEFALLQPTHPNPAHPTPLAQTLPTPRPHHPTMPAPNPPVKSPSTPTTPMSNPTYPTTPTLPTPHLPTPRQPSPRPAPTPPTLGPWSLPPPLPC